MPKIIVTGHLNPDTDTIASSIAIANLLNQKDKEASAFKKGNLNKETALALEYSGQKEKISDLPEEITEGQEIFLVDFNEQDQSPVNADKVKLVGLIDHHKLASTWKTEEPILFRIEPVGSSCTLTAKIYQENRIEFSESISKLLLCGIVSDTLKLTSPTTTDEDKIWASILAKQAAVDVDKIADDLFTAKSDLSEFTPEEIAKLDYKIFDFAGKKVGIGVIETVKPENAKTLEKELRDAMNKIKAEDGLDIIFLGIVDIIKNQTEILIISEEAKNIIMKSFSDIVINGENLVLRGVVSRKKQIAPAIEKTLKTLS